MPIQSADPPYREAFAIPASSQHALQGKLPKLIIGNEWFRWFGDLVTRIDSSPARQAKKSLSAQTAAIGTTALSIGQVSGGLWRISVHVRVTTPGTVSSSIQVSVQWTDGGVAQIQSTAALVGNTTTTREGMTVLARVDPATPISFSTAYASVGATPMQYQLDVVAEEVGID